MDFWLPCVLGPIPLLYDPELTNHLWGLVLCLLLIPCILAGIIWRRVEAALLSALGLVAWLLVGLGVWGITC
jgi:hypothetical protein